MSNTANFSLQHSLEEFIKYMISNKPPTLAPVLPLLLNLENKPYTLYNHFPFEVLFNTHFPRKIILKTGRQCAKSTSIAAHGILLAAIAPGSSGRFHTLYVTPLFEQIRRFSNNYVRPMIEQSPIKSLLLDVSCENNVLQRTFKNGSIMHFSYAGLTSDRTRGVRADRCAFDEVQDMDPDHFDIIEECMSASEFSISQYTGTPKTKDNAMEIKWLQSSQAEWVIKCKSCNFYNIPSIEWHLEKMIGPWHEGISEEIPATVCYKCSRPISPRDGRWHHRYEKRKREFAGYHVPQLIMPMHYAKQEKWSVLLSKQQNLSTASFYNEVMGESCDIATKLVSISDLQASAVLHDNIEEIAINSISNYKARIMGVDWGGGGKDGTSFTKISIVGVRPNGNLDLIFGKKLPNPHDHIAEANECRRLFNKFNCMAMSHDYTGAGTLRETFLVQSGFSPQKLMPMQYVRAASRGVIEFVPANDRHPRNYYRVDKTRSLQLTCYAIKLGLLRTFKYDYISEENPGLLHDFLALIENKADTAQGSDVYTIQRHPLMSDDFAQATNLACCAAWHSFHLWPNLTKSGVNIFGTPKPNT